MAMTRRWGRPSAADRAERERALGLSWEQEPQPAAQPVAQEIAQPEPTMLRAADAPVPTTPEEAELERLERELAHAWAAWEREEALSVSDAVELGRDIVPEDGARMVLAGQEPRTYVTADEVAAAKKARAAWDAYAAAVARLREREARDER